MPAERLIGITVLPEYLQSESVERVLDNLQSAGVTAVATSPYVMEVADAESGGREPPIDAGAGGVRRLERPLWGQRELWVRTAPSFVPERSLYQDLRYQPPRPTELTDRAGGVVDRLIGEAKARGLRVYLQVQAAIPPGYRVQFGGPQGDDVPRLPDGRAPHRRVDNNGSLASPHILAYQRALIRDLGSRYPDIDGLRFDWPEYPPYLIDSAFLDFCGHAEHLAHEWGLDFGSMRRDAGALYEWLHGGLQDETLRQLLTEDGGRFALVRLLVQWPGVAEWLHFKARLSERWLRELRAAMDGLEKPGFELAPSAFPPPWSLVSGMDFQRAAAHCDSVSVKLYGMHWAMMLRFYGDQLREANRGLSGDLLVRVLVRLLDIADDAGLPRLEDYRYPGPDEPHPVGANAQRRKVDQAQAAAGAMPVLALAHGYGPLVDFRERIRVAAASSRHGFWINRYGYLSDEKLAAVGAAVAEMDA